MIDQLGNELNEDDRVAFAVERCGGRVELRTGRVRAVEFRHNMVRIIQDNSGPDLHRSLGQVVLVGGE